MISESKPESEYHNLYLGTRKPNGFLPNLIKIQY